MSSLLDHLETERGPLPYEQLVSDIRGMAHCPEFPKTEGQLLEQLRALERAGRIERTKVIENGREVEAVRVLIKREPQQAKLF